MSIVAITVVLVCSSQLQVLLGDVDDYGRLDNVQTVLKQEFSHETERLTLDFGTDTPPVKVVEQIVGLYVRIEPHTDPFLPRDRYFTIRSVVSVEFSTEIEAHSSKHGPMRLHHVTKSVVSGLVVASRRDAHDLLMSGPLRRVLASFRLPKKPPLVLRSQKRITSSRDRVFTEPKQSKKMSARQIGPRADRFDPPKNKWSLLDAFKYDT